MEKEITRDVLISVKKKWEHKVSAGEAGLPLAQILKAAGFTKNEISRQKFISDGITLDGEKCRVTQIAAEGQILVLNLDKTDKEYKESSGNRQNNGAFVDSLKILYEDDDVLIVNKPSGMSCHPGRGHYQDNLGSLALNYCSQKGEKFPIRQIGRLDKDTSGIVVFAKNKIAAARLWKQREDGRFQKKYIALVHGKMELAEGTIDLPVAHVFGEKNKMCTVFPENIQKDTQVLHAVTHYRVIGERTWSGSPATMVECILETGRTHQIRVHMAAVGHPLFGDCIYGRQDDAARLYLHAGEVSLFQPFTGMPIVLRADF